MPLKVPLKTNNVRSFPHPLQRSESAVPDSIPLRVETQGGTTPAPTVQPRTSSSSQSTEVQMKIRPLDYRRKYETIQLRTAPSSAEFSAALETDTRTQTRKRARDDADCSASQQQQQYANDAELNGQKSRESSSDKPQQQQQSSTRTLMLSTPPKQQQYVLLRTTTAAAAASNSISDKHDVDLQPAKIGRTASSAAASSLCDVHVQQPPKPVQNCAAPKQQQLTRRQASSLERIIDALSS